MLILVAISIRIVIDSNLMGKAREAGEATKYAYDNEARLGEKITVGAKEYNSIDEYYAELMGGTTPPSNRDINFYNTNRTRN